MEIEVTVPRRCVGNWKRGQKNVRRLVLEGSFILRYIQAEPEPLSVRSPHAALGGLRRDPRLNGRSLAKGRRVRP